jgi:hypothetical protein
VLNNFYVNILSPSRHHAKDLIKFLMTESEDFECVASEVLDDTIWWRIVKTISSMRAEIRRKSHRS